MTYLSLLIFLLAFPAGLLAAILSAWLVNPILCICEKSLGEPGLVFAGLPALCVVVTNGFYVLFHFADWAKALVGGSA